MNLYTHEKLLQLERERLARLRSWAPPPSRSRRTIFGPLATFSGRALRRAGESLESWGAPPCPPEPDQRRAQPGM